MSPYFVLHVLNFNGTYNGHIPIAAVSSMIAPTLAATIPPIAPSITFSVVNASVNATTPTTPRTARSAVPTFLQAAMIKVSS